MDEELEALLENGEGLYDEKEVVSLCRLMVRVETMEQKLICLKLIQVSTPDTPPPMNTGCLGWPWSFIVHYTYRCIYL